MAKASYVAGFLLAALFFIGGIQLCASTNSASAACMQPDRNALLMFKRSLQDPSNLLSSWEGQHCCHWKGVSCDQNTGHVIKLHLRNSNLDRWCVYSSPNISDGLLGLGNVSISLTELKHLRYLDLSGNNFEYSEIPKFFGSLNKLRYLNLSCTQFTGKVPHQLGNLTNLQVLNLRNSPYHYWEPRQPYADNFQWASSLLSLQHLDMSGVDLGSAHNLMEVLTRLPSLQNLQLSLCNISNTHFQHALLNSTFIASIQSLDLSRNALQTPILNALQNMSFLRVLDISSNSFNSSVPLSLGNLKSLVTLNLGLNEFDSIEGELSSLINNYCHLKSLDLSENRFHGDTFGIGQNLSRCIMHSLDSLNLGYNKIGGQISNWLGQLRGLKHLDLSYNLLHGPIPSSLSNLSNLRVFDLSYNQLSGVIPNTLQNMSFLRVLDISSNSFNSSVALWLGNLKSLVTLNLGWNEFDSIEGGLSSLINNYCHLKSLDLSENRFHGEAFGTGQNLSRCIVHSLESLSLGSNKVGGQFPNWLGHLRGLQHLDLFNNSLNGPIPSSLSNLSNLRELDVQDNSLEGILSEIHFSNLSRLKYLYIGGNYNLTFKVSSDWIPPFSLQEINMDNCKIEGSEFPQWLRTQEEVAYLSLRNASISGIFPMWLQSMPPFLLDLSLNQISGPLPSNFGDDMPLLQSLLLSDNRINGSIPNSLCGVRDLVFLDLSRNMLHGKIPHCLTDSMNLQSIDLSSNKLSGTIPASIGNLPSLMWLHVNNNSLSGKLPLALINCSSLISMDLGENKLSGTIPTWIGENFLDLEILRLRENMFTGTIPLSLCRLSELRILDLGYNSLMGRIPPCFSNLRGMIMISSHNGSYNEKVMQVMKGQFLEYTRSVLRLVANMDLSSNKLVGHIPDELTTLVGLRGLNLSHNNLSGSIPRNIGNIISLESLDLSDNQLSGTIPNSMSILTSLAYLNLSHNKLSGKIPKGNQLQTLIDPSIYAGNLKLCGDPLPEKCPGEEEQVQPPMSIGPENEDKSEKFWFYFVVSCGYATGLSGVFGILMVKKNWRIAYFRYADKAKDWVLVMVAVKVARLKRKMERNNNVGE